MNRQRFLLLTAATTFLMFSVSAWADITGTVWRVPGNDFDAGPSSISGGTEEGTFTAPSINFTTAAGDTGNGTVGTLEAFLASGSATYTSTGAVGIVDGGLGDIMSGAYASAGTNLSNSTTKVTQADTNCYGQDNIANCYSTVIEITGFATFAQGQQYGITHDDGILLSAKLNGVTDTVLIGNATGPTSADTSFVPFQGTFSQTYTNVPFTLWYVGTNGNPEVLQANPNFVASTPEAGTISTLITMLIGVGAFAGIFKKKLA